MVFKKLQDNTLMKMKLIYLICFLSFANSIYGQTKLSGLVGASHIVIHQHNSGLQKGGYAFQLGLQSEAKISQKPFFFQTGVSYQIKSIPEYLNEPFSFDIQKHISVRTAFVQHSFEVPIYLKYRFEKNRISIGTGILFWFLFKQKINQVLTEELNFDTNTNARLKYNYEVSNNQIHLTNRFNLAPVICFSLLLAKDIELGFHFSYSLLNPSQVYLNYNKFNQITNTISINYNLNQKP